jgi:glycosyltransferase involved in cell wall biosynthesis
METLMSEPTLSVLMMNYNHAKYLPEALDAILSQSSPPKEFLIIDDASTDNSVEILESYAAKSPLIRLIRHEKNKGAIYNFAKLIEMASGDYLVGCACDDRVLPGFFEKSMAMVARYPQAAFCSGLCWMIAEDGTDIGLAPTARISDHACYLSPEDVKRVLCSYSNWIEANTTIFRRDAILEVGGLNPELRANADVFSFHLMALKYGACYIPEPLGAWRVMHGFAASCFSDPESHRKIWSLVADLMRNEHKDLFPKPYVDHWEEKMFRMYGRTSFLAVKAQQEVLLARLKDLHPSPNPLNRTIHLALRLVHRLNSALTLLYLRSVHILGEESRMRRRRLIHRWTRRVPSAGNAD